MLFKNRTDAGRELALKLQRFANRDDVIVLALPRGGVRIGYEVAQALNVPLDAVIVRKIGVPGHSELAMGAIASGGVRVVNDDVVNALGITDEQFEEVAAREVLELARREKLYRGDRPLFDVRGKTVLLVDDGLATGFTMKAAIRAMRKLSPSYIVSAVPVGAADTCAAMTSDADESICAKEPEPFYGVGMWYDDFSAMTDDEVIELLNSAWRDFDRSRPAASTN